MTCAYKLYKNVYKYIKHIFIDTDYIHVNTKRKKVPKKLFKTSNKYKSKKILCLFYIKEIHVRFPIL